jgi:histidine ammonia-lyase
VTNEELQEVDVKLARGYDLPHALAQKLRDQLANNAIKACAREKRVQDLERAVKEV